MKSDILNRSAQKRILSISIWVAAATTLAISPWSSTDPINPVKMLVISTGSISSFFIFLSSKSVTSLKIRSRTSYPFIIFTLALFVPFFFADAPRSQQFWGVFGRNTGLLTYLSLCLIAFTMSKIRLQYIESTVVRALLMVGTISLAYGFIQYLNLDPVSWSLFRVFGTLGNVNFYSAFMGICSVAFLTLFAAGRHSESFKARVSYLLLGLACFSIILATDSIQGIITALVGIFFAMLLIFHRDLKLSLKKILGIQFLTLMTLGPVGILGLGGSGPLASFLYQDSNVFRMDYMRAGIKMALNNAITGVGLDSYDNWYRKYRGFLAAFRTDPNRTSNSAHNIFIDIASGGGITLLVGYISIFSLTLWYVTKVVRFSREYNCYYVALVACWFAYLFQSFLSINQIGVGVWGWLLTGAILGSSQRLLENDLESKNNQEMFLRKRKSRLRDELPAISAILGIVGAAIGFCLSFMPYSADVTFRKVRQSGNVIALEKTIARQSINAFLMGNALQISISNNQNNQVVSIARELTSRFPREIYGWDIMSRYPNFSEQEKVNAKKNVEEIDPNFFCYSSNPLSEFKNVYYSLSQDSRAEILGWWGLIPRRGASQADVIRAEGVKEFESRILSFCQ